MRYFECDYSQGAHPAILKALADTNLEHTPGYGQDAHCERAATIIQSWIGRPDAHVHFLVGGTPANVITIQAALRPYECAVTAQTGHIFTHETGAVEATGHKAYSVHSEDGKLRPEMIQPLLDEYFDDHMVVPKLVYISNPTELGTIYSKAELETLSAYCRQNDLLLYLDGARLGVALTCPENDLTIQEIANLVDAFTIGGTKIGLLCGEAVVLLNEKMNDHYRFHMKQHLGMLAKGFILGVQFETLLEGGSDSLMLRMAAHENEMAKRLRQGIQRAGGRFLLDSPTNQIFPIFPNDLLKRLSKDFSFMTWGKYDESHSTIRLVTGWGTTKEDVDAFLYALEDNK